MAAVIAATGIGGELVAQAARWALNARTALPDASLALGIYRTDLRMVGHVAGELPEPSVRWIVDRAQGSPFFLQELLRVVALGGHVGDDSDLPDTVPGMVQARLDSFGPDAKLILRAASVFGETFRAADFVLAESHARAAMIAMENVSGNRVHLVALLARALAAQGRTTKALAQAREANAQLAKMGGVDDGDATIRLALAECLLAWTVPIPGTSTLSTVWCIKCSSASEW